MAGEGSNSAPAAETTTVETTVQRLPKTREKPPQLPPDSPTPPVHQAKTKTKKKRDKEKKEKKPAEETRAEQHEPSHPPKARTRKVEKPAEEDVVMATEDTASRMGDDSHSHSRMPRPKDVSKIKLPTSDTPIQRKNQAFRKGPGGERRRSSLGMRGRRASTMMESGIVGRDNRLPDKRWEVDLTLFSFFSRLQRNPTARSRMKNSTSTLRRSRWKTRE